MPLKAILLYLIQQAGYFERAGLQPWMDIFKAVLVPTEQSSKQIVDDNCRVFCLLFMDSIIHGLSIFDRITQAFVDKLKKDYSFEIFLNNTVPAEVVESQLRSFSLSFIVFFSNLVLQKTLQVRIYPGKTISTLDGVATNHVVGM